VIVFPDGGSIGVATVRVVPLVGAGHRGSVGGQRVVARVIGVVACDRYRVGVDGTAVVDQREGDRAGWVCTCQGGRGTQRYRRGAGGGRSDVGRGEENRRRLGDNQWLNGTGKAQVVVVPAVNGDIAVVASRQR